MDSIKFKESKDRVVFVCPHCSNKALQRDIFHHSINHQIDLGPNNYENVEIFVTDYYILFECSTCKNVCLRYYFSEEIEDGDDINYERITLLYPHPKDVDSNLPFGLSSILKEAGKVRQVSFLAYLILARKVLEEICKDRGVKSGNLQRMLIELIKKDELPAIFVNAIDKLRLLGNMGAHEIELDITKEDINLIEEFIFSLIEYIYVLPSNLKKLDDTLKKQFSHSNKLKKVNIL